MSFPTSGGPATTHSRFSERKLREPLAHVRQVILFVRERRLEAFGHVFLAFRTRDRNQGDPAVVVRKLRHENRVQRLCERRTRLRDGLHEPGRFDGHHVRSRCLCGRISAERADRFGDEEHVLRLFVVYLTQFLDRHGHTGRGFVLHDQ